MYSGRFTLIWYKGIHFYLLRWSKEEGLSWHIKNNKLKRNRRRVSRQKLKLGSGWKFAQFYFQLKFCIVNLMVTLFILDFNDKNYFSIKRLSLRKKFVIESLIKFGKFNWSCLNWPVGINTFNLRLRIQLSSSCLQTGCLLFSINPLRVPLIDCFVIRNVPPLFLPARFGYDYDMLKLASPCMLNYVFPRTIATGAHIPALANWV